MEALCAYIGQIYSELSEEEKLDLEEGEYFSQVFEKYNSYFDLDLEDVDARLQANYGITYLEKGKFFLNLRKQTGSNG